MTEQWDLGLQNLVVFTTVVESGGFTAAARKLGLRKSSVSRRVAQLEERLGVQLLQRTTRKLRLTDVGKEYYRRCARALAEMREAEEMVVQTRESPRGMLRVTTTQPLGETTLGPIVSAFLERYPGVEIDVQLSDRRVDLIADNIDVAIRLGSLDESSSLTSRSLGHVRTCYCASPEYLDIHGPPETPKDLGEHACLIIGDGAAPVEWPFVQAGSRIVVPVRGRMRTSSIWLAYQAVLSGRGIARLPRPLVARDIAAGRVVPVLDAFTPPSLPIHAVYHGRRASSPLLALFLDLLENMWDKDTAVMTVHSADSA